MDSRVPFWVGNPIVDIPVISTTDTAWLQFADDRFKKLYSMIINNYSKMRAAFGIQVSEGLLAPTSGHKFGPCWRYIHLISFSPLLAYPSFAMK
jgi:hypothetical protein